MQQKIQQIRNMIVMSLLTNIETEIGCHTKID